MNIEELNELAKNIKQEELAQAILEAVKMKEAEDHKRKQDNDFHFWQINLEDILDYITNHYIHQER